MVKQSQTEKLFESRWNSAASRERWLRSDYRSFTRSVLLRGLWKT
jgi:hypothetical protein